MSATANILSPLNKYLVFHSHCLSSSIAIELMNALTAASMSKRSAKIVPTHLIENQLNTCSHTITETEGYRI